MILPVPNTKVGIAGFGLFGKNGYINFSYLLDFGNLFD